MDVLLNGAPIGRTPLTGVILAPGDYLMEVRRAGMAAKTHGVVLRPSEGTEVLLTLDGDPAAGTLAFAVKPDGAEVKLMGQPLGHAPAIEPRKLPPGPYEVEVADPNGGHLPWKGTVTVRSGQEEVLDIALERKTGVLIVRAPPGAAVLVNHEPRRADRPIEVPEGVYDVRVMMPGHEPWRKDVRVPTGNTIELVAHPVPLGEAGLDTWRWAAIGAAGASVLAGVAGGVIGAGASAQFSEIQDRIALDGGYATQSEIDEIDGAQLAANVLFGLALAGVGSAAALWFREELGLGPAPDAAEMSPAARPEAPSGPSPEPPPPSPAPSDDAAGGLSEPGEPAK